MTTYSPVSVEDENIVYEKVEKIVCVSEETKKQFIKVYSQYKEKIEVIYNIIDKDRIIKLSQDINNIEMEENTIIAIGRLIKSKRFELLIKMHKELLDEGVKSNLIILGEGSERDKLEGLINDLGVKETVKLYGFVDNPYKYIKKADIVAITSEIEGLPTVICESMVLGKMIISTDCAGVNELLGNDDYGIVVGKDNYMEFKLKLKEILLNKDIRSYYEKRALQRSNIFNKNKVIKDISDLIEI